MTRTVLCLALSAATLFAGLMTAKLCSRNAARGEALYRLHLANEMQAAHNELLAAEVEGDPETERHVGPEDAAPIPLVPIPFVEVSE